MPLEATLALAITGAMIAVLATNRVSVETGMIGCLLIQVFVGAVSPERAVSGFSSPAVVAIASLFVVAASLFATGVTTSFATPVLGRPKTLRAAQARLILPVAALSSCINNTPVVAMYIPIVREWSRRIRISPSKLLMPMSFASLLGGQLTLIGSASNLIVMGLYVEYLDRIGLDRPLPHQQFWGPAVLGLPVATVGLLYLLAVSGHLLPIRRQAAQDCDNPREYTVEMIAPAGSPVVGSPIRRLETRNLPGLSLYSIERAGALIEDPGPELRVAAGDRLRFAGPSDSIVDLQKVRGLTPSNRMQPTAGEPGDEPELIEAVLSGDSPLAGKTVRDAGLEPGYGTGLIGLHRCGAALRGGIDDIVLQPGDTLLLEAASGFEERYRVSSDFSLVSRVPEFTPPNHAARRRAIAVCAALGCGIMLTSWPPMVLCLAAALGMVALGCLPATRAFQAVPLRVIATIAAALGLAATIEDSGAAKFLADGALQAAEAMGLGQRGMVLGCVATASALAQVINKNGAAALVFPVAMAAAEHLGVHPEPFTFSLIVGCGLSFMSPVSYNTNMMVYGPGGYKFMDYPRVGFPMTVILVLLAGLICPWAFPFRPLP